MQLTKEGHFHDKYRRLIAIPYRSVFAFKYKIPTVCCRSSIIRANLFGLCYAVANSLIFFSLAALFRLGAHLVSKNDIIFEDVLL